MSDEQAATPIEAPAGFVDNVPRTNFDDARKKLIEYYEDRTAKAIAKLDNIRTLYTMLEPLFADGTLERPSASMISPTCYWCPTCEVEDLPKIRQATGAMIKAGYKQVKDFDKREVWVYCTIDGFEIGIRYSKVLDENDKCKFEIRSGHAYADLVCEVGGGV